MSKVTMSREKQVIDMLTGEVIRQETDTVLTRGQEPNFIKLYLEDLLYLKNLPSKNAAVLIELAKSMTYAADKQIIVVNKYVKKEIAKKLDFKNTRSVDNIIQSLEKAELLIRLDRGTYQVNPHYLGKGDWKDISKLRIEIEYSKAGGRTVKAKVEDTQEAIRNIR